MIVGSDFGWNYRTRLTESSISKNLPKGRLFDDQGYLFNKSLFLESAQSRSADVALDFFAVNNKIALLNVGFKNLTSFALRKRDIMSVHFTFTGDFTDSHVISPSQC